MLTEVKIIHFKRFGEVTIPLDNPIVLAGPNNSGKTTAIQALSTWHFTMRKWLEKNAEMKKGGKKRAGVSIARRDFTPVPLREAILLWNNRSVLSSVPKVNTPLLVKIIVKGVDEGAHWECGMELQYANAELFYCRPIRGSEIPKLAEKVDVVHVPPLSGLKTEEGRRDVGEQNVIIGEGRPGEILRNLLLEIYEHRDKSLWASLERDIAEIFQVKVLPPQYSKGQPYIRVEYVAGLPKEGKKNGMTTLDIASGGSGFHQVLLLLAFFYARPSSVLLLDEPDAHLHVILQREVFDHLVRIASKQNSQLIVATHSEVVLEKTEPSNIVTFVGQPHRLVSTQQKSQLRKALTEIRGMDFLLADQKGGILYAEGTTDLAILKSWAKVLHHRAEEFLGDAYFKSLDGNDLNKARSHFFALKEAYPNLKGVCILDRTDFQLQSKPLRELSWRRKEVENYLIVPTAIIRFLKGMRDDLFAEQITRHADEWMKNELPPEAYRNPFSDQATLMDVKASESFFEKMFDYLNAKMQYSVFMSKPHLYLLAESMLPEEIHPEVVATLDVIAEVLCS